VKSYTTAQNRWRFRSRVTGYMHASGIRSECPAPCSPDQIGGDRAEVGEHGMGSVYAGDFELQRVSVRLAGSRRLTSLACPSTSRTRCRSGAAGRWVSWPGGMKDIPTTTRYQFVHATCAREHCTPREGAQ
jgi:hypothetical protein